MVGGHLVLIFKQSLEVIGGVFGRKRGNVRFLGFVCRFAEFGLFFV